MALTIRGEVGEVRWAYHLVGTLTEWTVTNDAGARTLTGTMQTSDTFRLTQQPLVFQASHPHGVWRWPIHSLQMTGTTLTASLGPQES